MTENVFNKDGRHRKNKLGINGWERTMAVANYRDKWRHYIRAICATGCEEGRSPCVTDNDMISNFPKTKFTNFTKMLDKVINRNIYICY